MGPVILALGSGGPKTGTEHVLGPDMDRFERLSTDSIRGVFRFLRLYGNLLKYGMDAKEDGYWGAFLGPILDRPASMSKDYG